MWMVTAAAPLMPWDDHANTLDNPLVTTAVSASQFWHPWFGLFIPATYATWRALFVLSSPDSFVVALRVANLVGHLVNTLLVYLICRRAAVQAGHARVTWVAAIAAAVFAWHPLQVGLVSWVSGFRDILSTSLALSASTLLYTAHEAQRPRRRYGFAAAALVVFVVALLAKPGIAAALIAAAVCLPLISGTTMRRHTVVTAALSLIPVGLVAQITWGSQASTLEFVTPWLWRPLVMLDAYGYHLFKSLLPIQLGIDQGRTPQEVLALSGLLWPVPLLTIGLGVGVVGLLGWAARTHRMRALRLGVAWALLLAPVSGMIPFAFQRVSTAADHYNYAALAVLALAVVVLSAQVPKRLRPAALAVGVMACVSLLSWSIVQARAWQSGRALFTHAVAVNPRSSVVWSGLASVECDTGDSRIGLSAARTAFGLDGANPWAVANLATCAFRLGDAATALATLPQAREPALLASLNRDTRSAASFLTAIGGSLVASGELVRGWVFVCQASMLLPNEPGIRQNLEWLSSEVAQRGVPPRCPPGLPVSEFLQRDYASAANAHRFN